MIDEKKLIKLLEELRDHAANTMGQCELGTVEHFSYMAETSAYNTAISIIKDTPKVDDWIPCSERLPGEEAEQYIRDVYNGKGSLYPCLVTYKIPNHERICISEFYYDIDEKCFINHEGRKETYCLAWMPLPEPWEGEE